MLFAGSSGFGQQAEGTTQSNVGRIGTNRFYTPVNQILTPAGAQIELPGMRPQALALSPDGRILATSGKSHELVVVAPQTGKVLQRVPMPSEKLPVPGPLTEKILSPDKADQLSFTGLAFSPDGSRIYLANVDGSIKVFGVGKDGSVSGMFGFALPAAKAPRRAAEIPCGIAVSPDGKRLYVALNLSNRLAEMDTAGGQVLRLWNVGVAPYDIVLAGHKAYVSNWGGRRPGEHDATGPIGRGTVVKVDPVRFIANDGSVSVIDLDAVADDSKINHQLGQVAGDPKSEILTGLHPCAMALSPKGRWLVVANAASDSITVIDTRSDQVMETICARQNPADLFGAQPDALAFDKDGDKLFVCNASQNAVAVVRFDPPTSSGSLKRAGGSRLLGLIPVGWFPGAIVADARRNSLYIANIKGIGPGRLRKPGEKESAAAQSLGASASSPSSSQARQPLAGEDAGAPREFNSHEHQGSISLVKVPSKSELGQHTRSALANMRYPLLRQAALPARPGQSPRPVPERVSEPSVFKHVVYIIKENRTYDQVLGDMKEGNGVASLCTFGEEVTPNQHRLSRQFVLLDNTYCSGILSADGHQWADTAFATEYMERSFAGFPRSYPDGMGEDEADALAYSPGGFIWDNALAHGRTLRDYGEFAISESRWKDRAKKGEPSFSEYYRDFIEVTGATEIRSQPAIESLRPYLATNTVGWDLSIPDVFRADFFIKELAEFERNGNFPNLVLFCLPNDHTSGTKAHCPTPAAMVADNDLALGRIIEAISRSRFWGETCIFVIEDDPQNGWDHVSGYRTTAYVASPYTRRGAVVSTQYNQTSLLRTIELMLGLPPMNQLDATATPMSDCFIPPGAPPDLAPFAAVPNNIPLDELNPEPKKVSDALLRKYAYASAHLRLNRPDRCPEDLLNRILWHAMKGPTAPFPEWAVSKAEEE